MPNDPRRFEGKRYRLVVAASVEDKSERELFEQLANRAALSTQYRCGMKRGEAHRVGKQTLYWVYSYNFDEPEPPAFMVTGRRLDIDEAYARAEKNVQGEG